MSQSLQALLGQGRAPSVEAAARAGLELLRLLSEKPTLRDPVEIGVNIGDTFFMTGETPQPGVGVYCCPEFERAPDGEPAQVYFVGAVLYHLLSGRSPFPDVGADALAVRKVLEPVAPLGTSAPGPLGELILAALSADASARPPVARMREVLTAAARGALSDEPSATAYMRLPGPPPAPSPMRAAPTYPGPGATGAIAPAPGAPRGVTGAAPTPPAPRRRWPLVLVALGLLFMCAAGIAALFLLNRASEPAPALSEAAPAPVIAAPAASAPEKKARQPDTATPPAEEARAEDEARVEPAPAAAPAASSSGTPSPGASASGGAAPPARASAQRPSSSAPKGGAEADDGGAVDGEGLGGEGLGGTGGGPSPAPEAGDDATAPVVAAAPAPVSTSSAAPRGPSTLMWLLLLVPVGLGVLLFGAGATGAAVYYTTRGTRRPSKSGSGRVAGATPGPGPSSGGSATFPSLATPSLLPDPALDAPEAGFQPFMVGPFWCFGRIGEGGMGVVYKARHRSLGRLSAVKALPPRLARDARSLSWFRREAQLAARVQHPNVVAIFDYGELPGGLLYLAMEYVPGEPLSRRVRPGGLVGAEVRTLVNQIAAGLDAAHAAGIVHRDLKPDNVVVQPAPGGRFNAKILDFGIARPAESSGETSADVIVGTAAYMSPEQARGEPDLDARSDLFSLGVMTYELLTGRVPFVEPNMRTIQIVTRRGILDGPPPPVRELRADLSPAVDRALAWVMAPRREDRPASATAFAEALGAALAG